MKKTAVILGIIAFMTLGVILFLTMPAVGQTWKPNLKYTSQVDTTHKERYQCWGTTKKGLRCNRRVSMDKGFCYQHAGQK